MLEDRMPPPKDGEEAEDSGVEHFSQPFAFSALFQSSRASSLRGTPTCTRPKSWDNPLLNLFVGFSWGPRLSAFNPPSSFTHDVTPIRLPLHREPVNMTPRPTLPLGTMGSLPLPRTDPQTHTFRTPVRSSSVPLGHRDGLTFSIPHTGTARRMQGERPMSDREVMAQLVDCVGMSARKKVLESGKKPTHIRTASARLGSKDIKRFVPIPKAVDIDAAKVKRDMSTTISSESESEPPSPTPRPGSALSRRSGWGGGRSTPSLGAGRSTPTLTFSGTSGSEYVPNGGAGATAVLRESSRQSGSFDERLREAERRHDKLLDEIAILENDISTVALHLKQP